MQRSFHHVFKGSLCSTKTAVFHFQCSSFFIDALQTILFLPQPSKPFLHTFSMIFLSTSILESQNFFSRFLSSSTSSSFLTDIPPITEQLRIALGFTLRSMRTHQSLSFCSVCVSRLLENHRQETSCLSSTFYYHETTFLQQQAYACVRVELCQLKIQSFKSLHVSI